MAKICNSELTAQRQYELHNSLLELMRVMPYEKITVGQICDHASIPRRTFYRYFECKDDVLQWTLNRLLDDCYLEVMFDFRIGPAQMKERFVRFFEFWQREQNRWKLECLLDNHMSMRMIASSMQKKNDEMAAYYPEHDPSFERLTVNSIMGTSAVFSVLFYWVQDHYRQSPAQMAAYAANFLPDSMFEFEDSHRKRI